MTKEAYLSPGAGKRIPGGSRTCGKVPREGWASELDRRMLALGGNSKSGLSGGT